MANGASERRFEAGLRAGANVYLVKPDTEQLITTVRRLLLEAAA